jgi:Na+-transporting NADH:ubiquinone oxidoreductase subunit NqrB
MLKIPKPRWPMWFTPKRELLVVLVILAAIGVWKLGWQETIPQLVVALVVGGILDYLLYRLVEKKHYFPEAGIISGLIVAMVLEPGAPLLAVSAVSALAVLSKHFIRVKQRHIFNPANFGLLLGLFLFPDVFHGWWGESIPWATAVLGLFLVGRLEAWGMVSTYFATWTLVLSGLLLSNHISLSILPQQFLATILFFFTFVMFIEPMTRPVTKRGRLVFGAAVAIFSYLFSIAGFQAPLIAALAAGNLLTPFVFNRIRP